MCLDLSVPANKFNVLHASCISVRRKVIRLSHMHRLEALFNGTRLNNLSGRVGRIWQFDENSPYSEVVQMNPNAFDNE